MLNVANHTNHKFPSKLDMLEYSVSGGGGGVGQKLNSDFFVCFHA